MYTVDMTSPTLTLSISSQDMLVSSLYMHTHMCTHTHTHTHIYAHTPAYLSTSCVIFSFQKDQTLCFPPPVYPFSSHQVLVSMTFTIATSLGTMAVHSCGGTGCLALTNNTRSFSLDRKKKNSLTRRSE